MSPPTPFLTRSDSSDSGLALSPSPDTPVFDYSSLAMPQRVGSPFSVSSGSSHGGKEAMFPFCPTPGQLPCTTAPFHQAGSAPAPAPTPVSAPIRSSPSPVPTEDHGRKQPSAVRPPPVRKSHYPCPLAKQLGCTDLFTTSGHAARHAKKHTGKKDALCPECNKAFTRKDNMEQHRRTHQSGRGMTKGPLAGRAKTKARHQPQQPQPQQPQHWQQPGYNLEHTGKLERHAEQRPEQLIRMSSSSSSSSLLQSMPSTLPSSSSPSSSQPPSFPPPSSSSSLPASPAPYSQPYIPIDPGLSRASYTSAPAIQPFFRDGLVHSRQMPHPERIARCEAPVLAPALEALAIVAAGRK